MAVGADAENLNRFFADAGIPVWGICRFADFADHLLPCAAIRRIPEQAQTILTALFPYRTEEPRGDLSRYAAVPDYHLIAGKMLEDAAEKMRVCFAGYQFVPFCDNSPIPEVEAGVRSGLGVKGCNRLLIHPVYGSWVFVGEIVTDYPVEAPPVRVGSCLKCGLCEMECPGGALQNGAFDQAKCLSAITQKKKDLTQQEIDLIRAGGLVWGCDRCQEVCPMNRHTQITPIAAFRDGVDPWFRADQDLRKKDRAYLWRGEQVPGRNASLLKEGQPTK